MHIPILKSPIPHVYQQQKQAILQQKNQCVCELELTTNPVLESARSKDGM